MPLAKISVSGEYVCGRIALNGFHHGMNFPCMQDETDPDNTRWAMHNCEYIDEMGAIAPCNTLTWADMDKTAWTEKMGVGDWTVTRPAITRPRVKFIHYRRAEIGKSGRVLSTGTYKQGMAIRTLRFVPVDGETATPHLLLEFAGINEGYAYGLDLPWAVSGDDEDGSTKLYREPFGTAFDLDNPFATLDIAPPQTLDGAQAMIQDISIEQLGDYLIIRLSNSPTPWIVKTGDHPFTESQVAVSFVGHSGMFNIQSFGVATDGFAVPCRIFTFAGWMTQDTAYSVDGYAPQYSSIGYAEDATLPAGQTRPVVTFGHNVGGTATGRPLLYNVQMWSPPTVEIQEKSVTEVVPTEVQWSRDNTWRAGHFVASYRAPLTPHFKHNMQAELNIGWDDMPLRLTGYINTIARRYSGERNYTQPTIEADCHPVARLSEAKWMRSMPDFTGWQIDELFMFLLNTAGVDETFVNIDDSVPSASMVRGEPPWERRWQYNEQTGLIQAMDDIFTEQCGLQWGWSALGYFLRAKPEYTGTPDWLLDPQTETMRQMITTFNADAALDEMFNYAAVRDTANNNLYISADAASQYIDTASNYIGDDRWQILQTAVHGATEGFAATRAALAKSKYANLRISIETEYDKVGPDMFVQIVATNDPLIPDNSVFRIISEEGTANADDMTITYMCEFDSIQEVAE